MTTEVEKKVASNNRIIVGCLVAMCVVIVAMLAVFFVQQEQAISAEKKTLTTLVETAKVRSNQIDDLQKHIDCVVSLFQSKNRANLVITDIENCKIDTNTSATVQKTSTAPSPSSTSAKPVAKIATSPSPSPSSSQAPSQQESIKPTSNPICSITILGLCL